MIERRFKAKVELLTKYLPDLRDLHHFALNKHRTIGQIKSVLDVFDILEPRNEEELNHIKDYARNQFNNLLAEKNR